MAFPKMRTGDGDKPKTLNRGTIVAVYQLRLVINPATYSWPKTRLRLVFPFVCSDSLRSLLTARKSHSEMRRTRPTCPHYEAVATIPLHCPAAARTKPALKGSVASANCPSDTVTLDAT